MPRVTAKHVPYTQQFRPKECNVQNASVCSRDTCQPVCSSLSNSSRLKSVRLMFIKSGKAKHTHTRETPLTYHTAWKWTNDNNYRQQHVWFSQTENPAKEVRRVLGYYSTYIKFKSRRPDLWDEGLGGRFPTWRDSDWKRTRGTLGAGFLFIDWGAGFIGIFSSWKFIKLYINNSCTFLSYN